MFSGTTETSVCSQRLRGCHLNEGQTQKIHQLYNTPFRFSPTHLCFSSAHFCFRPTHFCFSSAHFCFSPTSVFPETKLKKIFKKKASFPARSSRVFYTFFRSRLDPPLPFPLDLPRSFFPPPPLLAILWPTAVAPNGSSPAGRIIMQTDLSEEYMWMVFH